MVRFSGKEIRGMTGDTQSAIQNRVPRAGPPKVFIAKDFLDLGGRVAADKALSRLVKSEDIQRLGRGPCHLPQVNTRLRIAVVSDADEIADAPARQTWSSVVPSGEFAANQRGLSAQVPSRPVYLTDGRSHEARVGNSAF